MTTSLPGSSDVIIKEGKKFVYLSDWDGTITTQDSNDYLIDNYGMGKENRERLNVDILSHKLNFRDAFFEMLRSVKLSFPECMEELKRGWFYCITTKCTTLIFQKQSFRYRS